MLTKNRVRPIRVVRVDAVYAGFRDTSADRLQGARLAAPEERQRRSLDVMRLVLLLSLHIDIVVVKVVVSGGADVREHRGQIVVEVMALLVRRLGARRESFLGHRDGGGRRVGDGWQRLAIMRLESGSRWCCWCWQSPISIRVSDGQQRVSLWQQQQEEAMEPMPRCR